MKQKYFNVTFRKELADKIEKIANDNNLSINDMIIGLSKKYETLWLYTTFKFSFKDRLMFLFKRYKEQDIKLYYYIKQYIQEVKCQRK